MEAQRPLIKMGSEVKVSGKIGTVTKILRDSIRVDVEGQTVFVPHRLVEQAVFNLK